jgi:outer membrane receptor protein involved in Fe transport
MQIRYRLTPDSAIRAVYARGIARPDAYQLVPYVTEDSAASPIAVSIGNPALRPEHANNYDLLYETFLHPLGMIQAGVFVKQLTAPQLLTTIPGGLNLANFPPGYFPPATLAVIEQYPGDAITQYINGENAFRMVLRPAISNTSAIFPAFCAALASPPTIATLSRGRRACLCAPTSRR